MSHRSVSAAATWSVPEDALLGLLLGLCVAFMSGCGSKDGRRPFFDYSQAGGGAPAELTGGEDIDFACDGVNCPEGFVCDGRGDDAACVCQGDDCDDVGCFTAPCAEFASCSDLEDGSFQCACFEGFAGNGFACTAGDPCGDLECPGEHAVCRANATGGLCVCEEGYEPLPGTESCVDVDECELTLDLCGPAGVCHNYPGGFLCDCAPGFEMGKDGCVDVDECALGIDACDQERGECTNTLGSFGCSCVSGAGEGELCKDVGHCEVGTCQNGGDCIETPSGAACRCPIGTTGARCEDQDTCHTSVVLNDLNDPMIVDPVVREAVEQAVGAKPGEPVTVQDLEGHYELYVSTPLQGEPVATSLEGLQCWPTLSTLNLAHHAVSDLSPLQDLGALLDLDLTCNPVTDLAPLEEHILLTSLSLEQSELCEGGDQAGTLESLAQLIGLRTLSIQGQGVSELSALSGLASLEVLNISQNPVSHLDSIGDLDLLGELYAWETGLSDLSELGELVSLRRVDLSNSSVSSVAGLASVRELRDLNVIGNDLEDLSGVEGLSYLRSLLARDNRIEDVSALAEIPWIVRSNLQNNNISTLRVLVESPAWGTQGQLVVDDNPLPCAEELVHVELLEARGVSVSSDCTN